MNPQTERSELCPRQTKRSELCLRQNLKDLLGDEEYQLTFLLNEPLETARRGGSLDSSTGEVVEHVLHLPKQDGEGEDTHPYPAFTPVPPVEKPTG